MRIVAYAAAAASMLLGLGCAYNEELGRNQLLFVSQGQMAELAGSAWTDLKQQQRVSNDPKYTSRVNRVAPKIIRAAGGNPAEWEVQVFESDQLNAFALPGGKIGFYTGILDLMDNDDQIAAVMGHEVAHVNFNHSGERFSQTTAAQAGLGAASAAVGGSQTGAAAMQALGLGAQVGLLLPFSRRHELEADKFGVRYMHRAGYDADEAVKFWQKMASSKSGAPPEFLSTHPADATRIAALKREIALLN
ncbi:MAG: M48 family metallopeptidase [Pseudomonadota bacterium]